MIFLSNDFSKVKRLVTTIAIVALSKNTFSQGPFVGISVNSKSYATLSLGQSVLNAIELGATYSPRVDKKTLGGFIGGNLKVPLYYFPVVDNYTSFILLGFYSNATFGKVFYPRLDKNQQAFTAISKSDWGGVYGGGLEIMFLNTKFNFSIPIEIGRGKLHFTQRFSDQDPILNGGYKLIKSTFINAGIRIFFMKSKCENYTQELLNGG